MIRAPVMRVRMVYRHQRGVMEVVVRCPFCGKDHQHGWAGDLEVPQSRVAHCGTGSYEIALPPDVTFPSWERPRAQREPGALDLATRAKEPWVWDLEIPAWTHCGESWPRPECGYCGAPFPHGKLDWYRTW